MIGTRHQGPGVISRPAALLQLITNLVALRQPAKFDEAKADKALLESIHVRPQPPLCKAREMRIAIERPRIPWHQHPGWIEYAEREGNPVRYPPAPVTEIVQ